MASSRNYLAYILEQLSGLAALTFRPMMGEYLLYDRGRLFGGIYDNRLLVKPIAPALQRLPNAPREAPYPGAKPLLLVENVDDRAFLTELVQAMYDALPAPKPKKP